MAEHADLLFELGTEELPPIALKHLSEALTHEFTAGLEKANLTYREVKGFATPRRLALLVTDCGLRQPDRDVERRGPAVKAAFDADGNPTRAAEGFARSCNTTVNQLTRSATDNGEWLTYRLREPGKTAAELLPGIAEGALNRLPIPKRMRWGASEAQFIRPVHWLLFLHGDGVIPCTILGVEAGRTTRGHRFHYPHAINITTPAGYADQLQRTGYVIADFAARRSKIVEQVTCTAKALAGKADLDPELLDEVTALNEWPIPIAASFEKRFLEVPHEALVLTMKESQKYFPLFDAEGRLMNHFITIANIDSPRPEIIKEGNERVVRPRLADAMFFWQQDGKTRLEEHIESLKRVVFQKQLGSMYEKSGRVAQLAAYIAQLIGGDKELAHRAGLLSRCDLMTAMVYELPKMQGIMGRYQARRDGEPEELGQAMDEFYMPRFSGDQLARSKTGIAISLAERVDTLAGIFAIGERPTGDKDPFALRRAALGALRIMKEHQLVLPLDSLLTQAVNAIQVEGKPLVNNAEIQAQVKAFLLDRLKGLYLDEGIPVETFHAVSGSIFDTVANFDRRVHAVVQFIRLPEAEALAAANKRIRNILRKADGAIPDDLNTGLFQLKEERQLFDRIDAVDHTVAPLLASGDYEETLKALAGLREPLDQFFDKVMVMDEDLSIRGNRLALLTRLGNLFLEVADLSHLPS